jgi:pimeloyl-ACP methyl ester carboxylesterase
VVLVHRAGGIATEWDEVISCIGALDPGRTVVAIDLPGRSAADHHPGSIAAMAEAVVNGIIAIKRGPVLVAGHSMGGAVALACALDFPAWVKGLVIAGSSAEMTIPRAMAEIMDGGLTLSDRDFAAESLSGSLGRERRDELVTRMGKVPYSVLRADLRASSSMDLRGRLSEITVPVRIVMGRDDRLVPPLKGMKLRDAIPGASLRILDGVGHMLQWEAARELATQIAAMAARLDGG